MEIRQKMTKVKKHYYNKNNSLYLFSEEYNLGTKSEKNKYIKLIHKIHKLETKHYNPNDNNF